MGGNLPQTAWRSLGSAPRFISWLWERPPDIPAWLHLEQRFVAIRWIVLCFAVPAALLARITPEQSLGVRVILALAVAYNASLQLMVRRSSRYLRNGYLSIAGDSFLAVAIVLLGGGFDTPFYYNLFVLASTVALRKGCRVGLLAGSSFVLIDLAALLTSQQAITSSFLFRSGYLVVIVLLTSYVHSIARRAQDALQKRLYEANLLNTASTILATHPDLQGTVSAVVDATAHVFPNASVILEPGPELEAHGIQRIVRPAKEEPSNETPAGPKTLVMAKNGQGTILATLTVQPPQAGGGAELDPATVHAFAERIGLALESAMLYGTVAYQATHDALTDLPNRAFLDTYMRQAMKNGPQARHGIALLLLDLDRFKDVNDTFGHVMGDELLKELARRLKGLVRGSDVIARLGGDEFALVIHPRSLEDVERVAQRTLAAVREPFLLQGRPFHFGASIGIALFPDSGSDFDTLLRRADVAMYIAKRKKVGYAIYSDRDDQHSANRVSFVQQFGLALKHNELVLHYQPKLDLRTGSVKQVEALVRWQHPNGSLVYPSDFIPQIEQGGDIAGLTEYVVRSGLRQCREWLDVGLAVHVSINLSMRNLQDPCLSDMVEEAIRTYRIPSDLVQFELTETSAMTSPERTLRACERLSHLGASLSIDDFGTGFSSLAYLQRLPVREIKIDKSFIHRMATEENDTKIVRGTIELAHSLGLEVVAEGVEDLKTCRLLAHLGCDAVQGYYVAKPMPAAQFAAIGQTSLAAKRYWKIWDEAPELAPVRLRTKGSALVFPRPARPKRTRPAKIAV